MKGKSSDGIKSKIIIAVEVALLLTVISFIVIVLNEDKLFSSEETTLYVTTQKETQAESVQNDSVDIPDDEVVLDGGSSSSQKVPSGGGNSPAATNSQNAPANKLEDPSGWSKSQIIAKAADAVNKTKGYTGNLTVNHSESFSADVTECSGGGVVRSVVDLMVGWVVKPVNETLTFQNGYAVNSEGETVPILLPKKNNFNLSENGATSATVQRVGNEYVIKINIVQESVGMYQVPTHNAASVGYLDVANFDISFMEVDSADIVYKGSSLELRINADGYVTYANYQIPIHIDGSAHKGSISGSASFEGQQTETWSMNY